MIRGTFANIRLRNQLLDGVEGGYTRDFTRARTPRRAVVHLRRVAPHYAAAGIPLVVLAGAEYGSGPRATGRPRAPRCSASRPSSPSRYERIHRSNLIGMGVIPLQFPAGETAKSLGLDGTETFDIVGITELNAGTTPRR